MPFTNKYMSYTTDSTEGRTRRLCPDGNKGWRLMPGHVRTGWKILHKMNLPNLKVVPVEKCLFGRNTFRRRLQNEKSVKERRLIWKERRKIVEKCTNKPELYTNERALSLLKREKQ